MKLVLLDYVRAAAEEFRRCRVFRIVIRAEDTASVGLHAVQRSRRCTLCQEGGLHFERGGLRNILYLDPRWFQRPEHRAEYRAV